MHVDIEATSAFLQALSDPLRIRIMRLLLERELCVCELMDALDVPQYKISRQLGILKRAGLIRGWREGTWIHYECAPSLPAEWMVVLNGLKAAWNTLPEVREDLCRLEHPKRSPGEACSDIRRKEHK